MKVCDKVDYSIKIDEFEGPLDLLLHLIKESNINIYDIKVEEIAKQYLEYIEHMEELNINVASSYLVMASELIELKSKSLLPQKEEIGEDNEEINTKENLIRKLVEYQKYKDISNKLKDFEVSRKDIFVKLPEVINNYLDETTTLKGKSDISVLMEAFNNFLERQKLSQPLSTSVTTKEYSVQERVRDITKILKERKCVKFQELFDIKTKEYIVVTFLSILEMVKDNRIEIQQENNFNDIILNIKEVNHE